MGVIMICRLCGNEVLDQERRVDKNNFVFHNECVEKYPSKYEQICSRRIIIGNNTSNLIKVLKGSTKGTYLGKDRREHLAMIYNKAAERDALQFISGIDKDPIISFEDIEKSMELKASFFQKEIIGKGKLSTIVIEKEVRKALKNICDQAIEDCTKNKMHEITYSSSDEIEKYVKGSSGPVSATLTIDRAKEIKRSLSKKVITTRKRLKAFVHLYFLLENDCGNLCRIPEEFLDIIINDQWRSAKTIKDILKLRHDAEVYREIKKRDPIKLVYKRDFESDRLPVTRYLIDLSDAEED